MRPDSTGWERLQAVFERALDLPEDRRGPFLDDACRGDAALRREVEEMLAAESAEYALGIERLVNDTDPVAPDPFIGMRLGPWRAAGVIGRGGMGTVYLAERADGQYEQRVALKVVGAAGAGGAASMSQAERRILARLSHPNIARLLDAGHTPEGSPYMVMELVEGLPITTYCDTHRLTVEDRLRLFRVVCDATQHAHQMLVVHRDLKPSNIFVTRDGQVKLLDFGVAKLLEPEPGYADPATREHRAVTLAYAAPEQLRGEPVTTATDVYGLGVVLYELLTGRRPFDAAAGSPFEVERRIMTADPAPPSQAVAAPASGDGADPARVPEARSTTRARLARRLRGDIDRIVLEALRREPGRRYSSAGQLAGDIDRCLAGRPVSAQPDSLTYRMRRFVGRNRLAVGAAAALALLLAVFSILTALQSRRVAAERDRALVEQRKAEEVVRLLVDLFQSANPDVVPGGDRLAIGDFLERAEARALRELEAQPELASRMQHVLGLVHQARSDHVHARSLLENALAATRRVSGEDSLETLAVQVDLGRLLAWMGEGERGRVLLDDALDRIRRGEGAGDRLEASACHARAIATPDLDEQQACLERAVAIGRDRLPPTDPERIGYITTLAGLHLRRGRLDAARRLFDEAQRSAETLNGGRTTALIAVLNDAAALDNAVGDFRSAEARHRRALALAADLVGPDSFHVANGLNNLAVVLANQGRLDETADVLQEAYTRTAVLFGDRHWRTTNTMRNVGMAMLLLDRPAECEQWMTRAVESAEAGDRDPWSRAYMRAQLARCVVRGGRVEEGIGVLEAAIEPLEAHRAIAQAANYLANARLWLAAALVKAGRAEAAEPLAAAAVEHYRQTRDAAHPVRAEAECELAQVLAARGRPEEARPLAEACVPLVASYGQMLPWRKESAVALLARLRAGGGAVPAAAR